MNYDIGDIVIVTACMVPRASHDFSCVLPQGKYVVRNLIQLSYTKICPNCVNPVEYATRVFNDKVPMSNEYIEYYGYNACCFTLAPRPVPQVEKQETKVPEDVQS